MIILHFIIYIIFINSFAFDKKGDNQGICITMRPDSSCSFKALKNMTSYITQFERIKYLYRVSLMTDEQDYDLLVQLQDLNEEVKQNGDIMTYNLFILSDQIEKYDNQPQHLKKYSKQDSFYWTTQEYKTHTRNYIDIRRSLSKLIEKLIAIEWQELKAIEKNHKILKELQAHSM